MAAERIIGVDFGTSTSVIRIKRYQNGNPVGDRLDSKSVTFNMGSTMVPTLVQKLSNGQSVFWGYEAEIPHKDTKTYSNFKVQLEDSDPYVRKLARELTVEYFTYLAKTYRTQSDGGHLGENTDHEKTIISYPVKWSEETRQFMLKAAKMAGFLNVEGMDEAQAAIRAVTVQNADLLSKKGYFKEGVPVNILLIDMGAGTTDLVLCRHTPSQPSKTEILCTWPQNGTELFGGREIDELLRNHICSLMPADVVQFVAKKLDNEKYKVWKETIVSPALQRGETVDYFAALDDLLSLLDLEVEYSVSRESFETFAYQYLCGLPNLVNGCLKTAGMAGDNVDLVILTGGHSQWYFTWEILTGRMSQFGTVGLSKLSGDPGRIIPLSRPQETVALGLVYGPMMNQLTWKPEEALHKETAHVERPMDRRVEEAAKKTEKPVYGNAPAVSRDHREPHVNVAAGEYKREDVGKSKEQQSLIQAFRNSKPSSWTQYLIPNQPATNLRDFDANRIIYPGWDKPARKVNVNRLFVYNDLVYEILENGSIKRVDIPNGKRPQKYQKDMFSGLGDWYDWENIERVFVPMIHSMSTIITPVAVGIKKDGTVTACKGGKGRPSEYDSIREWKNILDVGYTDNMNQIVGLQNDGTMITSYQFSQKEWNDWTDIAKLYSAGGIVIGLKKDGRVMKSGHGYACRQDISFWRDIKSIVIEPVRGRYIAALHNNGTVSLSGQPTQSFLGTSLDKTFSSTVASWKDIEIITPGSYGLIALTKEGKVLDSMHPGVEVGRRDKKAIDIMGHYSSFAILYEDGTGQVFTDNKVDTNFYVVAEA